MAAGAHCAPFPSLPPPAFSLRWSRWRPGRWCGGAGPASAPSPNRGPLPAFFSSGEGSRGGGRGRGNMAGRGWRAREREEGGREGARWIPASFPLPQGQGLAWGVSPSLPPRETRGGGGSSFARIFCPIVPSSDVPTQKGEGDPELDGKAA